MKKIAFIFFIFVCLSKTTRIIAQNASGYNGLTKLDSLIAALKSAKQDTSKVKCLNGLGWELKNQNPDSSIALSKQALQLSEKLNWKKGTISFSLEFQKRNGT